jgi:hypothetical protein
MRTKEFRWDIDGNKRNLMGTVWERDGKSSPDPFKKIRNIPWGHVCATQLAHPINPKKKKKHWHSSHALSKRVFLGTSF